MPTVKQTFTDPVYFLALGLGSGLSKKAPGTCGSFVALVLYLPLSLLPFWAYITFVGSAFMLGIYICDRAARKMNIKDPGSIVCDEFVGMWITLLLVPEGWYFLILGFLLFRLFDIVKPWPVNYLDRKISGGLGIMVDDVAAGLYAFASLQLLAYAARTIL